jgi:uncharacterized protein (TIGR02453 family)
MTDFEGFGPDFAGFLAELGRNNERAWFDRERARYEASVRGPFLAFVRALGPRLKRISSELVADDRKSGGSMMRQHRDIRFSKDKRPYNTHVSAIFHHSVGKKVPAPGYYLRITADEVALGCGIWQPEKDALAAIREAIVADPQGWVRARDAKGFRTTYGELAGESLKRPPRGFDKEHPLVEDLKRKDFVGFRHDPVAGILDPDFPAEVVRSYAAGKPLMKFLCGALDLPF